MEIVLAIRKGCTQCFGVVLTPVLVLEVSTILEGGTKGFRPLKWGAYKVLLCLEGGGAGIT